MLERTLAHDFSLASNLPSGRDETRWTFLLPSLAIDDVRVLGVPSVRALEALARMASGSITVVPGSRSEAAGLRRDVGRIGLGSRVVVKDPEPGRSDDRVPLSWTPGQVRGLPAAPHAGGLYFVELANRPDPAGDDEQRNARFFALRPPVGDIRVAAPLERSVMLSAFVRETTARTVAPGWIPRLRRRRVTERVGGLLGATGDAPPAYVVEAASRHGLDISSSPWAVRLGGDFASQKVVFVIGSAHADDAPEMVVKLTMWPELNSRLEGEYAALSRLQEVSGIDPSRAPRPIFLDQHAGRAMVAESHLAGAAFPRPRRRAADIAALDDALDWLRGLAVATRSEVPASAVAGALDALVERFVSTYRPDRALEGFLRRQTVAIRGLDRPFPAVMMHGDCGAWNLRVAADGRVLFLDWEAADPLGLPLWDVFHLFRSVAVLAPRGLIPRRRIERIRRHLVEDGPIGQQFAAAVRNHVEAVRLAPELVEPLFHLCWMHRALKEATRLPPTALGGGHYVRLLRMFVANRDGPVLRRVFRQP